VQINDDDDDDDIACWSMHFWKIGKSRNANPAMETDNWQVSVAEWLARLTAVWEDPGSNHAADSCVYRDSCCDIQSW